MPRVSRMVRGVIEARRLAATLGVLALSAATLLPGVHALQHSEPATHDVDSRHACGHHHDCCDGHDDQSSPAPEHDRHSCDLCQLIAATTIGGAPTLAMPVVLRLAVIHEPVRVLISRPVCVDLSPGAPTRGPPRA